MDYLLDTTENAVMGLGIKDTIRYINKYWFNDYYNMNYIKNELDFEFVVIDRDMTIEGQGNDLPVALSKYIQECNIKDIKLEKHLRTAPKTGGEIKIPPKIFLTNVSLSCALDSLLSIIFFPENGYFMARIADSSNQVPKLVDRKDAFRRARKIVHDKLFGLFDRIEWKGMNVRDIQNNVNAFIEDDCADIKSVNEIWGVLATMFDGLAYEILTKRQKKIGNKPVEYYTIPIGDEIFPDDLVNKPYHLVYLNDTNIRPIDFRMLGYLEEMDGYRLVGIVNHTGAHYTSKLYVQEKWYSYDDLNGLILPYKGDVLKQTLSNRIILLFYVKI